VSKSTVINRLLGDPNDFRMVRRPGEGRKPIFSFLDTAAAEAAAMESAKKSSAASPPPPPPPPPVQKVNLIVKPVDKYEQKLLAELAKDDMAEEEGAAAGGDKALAKLHRNRRIQAEEEEEAELVRKSAKSGRSAVEGIRERPLEEERWPEERPAAVGHGDGGYEGVDLPSRRPVEEERRERRMEGGSSSRERYNSGEGAWRDRPRDYRSGSSNTGTGS
jgi:hypothetical protein